MIIIVLLAFTLITAMLVRSTLRAQHRRDLIDMMPLQFVGSDYDDYPPITEQPNE